MRPPMIRSSPTLHAITPDKLWSMRPKGEQSAEHRRTQECTRASSKGDLLRLLLGSTSSSMSTPPARAPFRTLASARWPQQRQEVTAESAKMRLLPVLIDRDVQRLHEHVEQQRRHDKENKVSRILAWRREIGTIMIQEPEEPGSGVKAVVTSARG